MQYIKIGQFELGIPNEMMFDVATLKVDIRQAIEGLQYASMKYSLDLTPLPEKPKETIKSKAICKMCKKKFVSFRTLRTHKRKYHTNKEGSKR